MTSDFRVWFQAFPKKQWPSLQRDSDRFPVDQMSKIPFYPVHGHWWTNGFILEKIVKMTIFSKNLSGNGWFYNKSFLFAFILKKFCVFLDTFLHIIFFAFHQCNFCLQFRVLSSVLDGCFLDFWICQIRTKSSLL